MTAMAHLTCAATRRDELTRDRRALPRRRASRTSSPWVAIRRPTSSSRRASCEHAVDLVRLVRVDRRLLDRRRRAPRATPAVTDASRRDRRHTAEKLAEADFAITQFFFDADHYFDLVESLRGLGVDKPVIPGIMPVLSIAAIERMSRAAGLRVPRVARREARTRSRDDPAAVRRVGIEEATRLCQRAARRRRARAALLHAEPLDRDAARSTTTSGLEPAS